MNSGRPTGRELVAALVDDSFESWDEPAPSDTFDESYGAALARARQASGADESVLTGRGRVGGIDAALLVSEFDFLGGSIGYVAARRLVDAVRRATELGLPVIAAPASGGTRMQEGTPAFVQMIAIAEAVDRHKQAGLPYVVYLRHPTTGGVLASWASMGHVTMAEPGALVGLLGPRVIQAVNGTPLPAGVQTAEHLADVGIIDAVVPPGAAGRVLRRVLRLLRTDHEPKPEPIPIPTTEFPSGRETPAWESVQHTRSPNRPGIQDLLRACSDETFQLSGSGAGDPGQGLMLALARLRGRNCVVVGHDRRATNGGSIGPAALRTARRGIRLADELGIPVITVIDTPGAQLSTAAEEGGLAGEIARTLADLRRLRPPSAAILLGQGCGGGALALLGTRRVVAAEYAWLSPLPFEGASAIVYRDAHHAAEMADRLRIRAVDLQRSRLIDSVVHEPDPPGRAPVQLLRRIVLAALHQIQSQQEDQVVDRTHSGSGL